MRGGGRGGGLERRGAVLPPPANNIGDCLLQPAASAPPPPKKTLHPPSQPQPTPVLRVDVKQCTAPRKAAGLRGSCDIRRVLTTSAGVLTTAGRRTGGQVRTQASQQHTVRSSGRVASQGCVVLLLQSPPALSVQRAHPQQGRPPPCPCNPPTTSHPQSKTRCTASSARASPSCRRRVTPAARMRCLAAA